MLTQGWRAFSEVLRADYRGAGKITGYQVMKALWRPEVFLLLQALWVIVFIMFGKSMVTGAQIFFDLRDHRI